jgi:hypothetical protein
MMRSDAGRNSALLRELVVPGHDARAELKRNRYVFCGMAYKVTPPEEPAAAPGYRTGKARRVLL